MDTRETGGADSIDVRLQRRAPPVRPRAIDYLLRSRAALGLQPLTAPALVFVPLGMALGPMGLGVLPTGAIVHLDPFITIALASLGIFVGMGLELRGAADRRLFAVASVEALTTVVAVMGTTLVLLRQWGLVLDTGSALVAGMLGIAASVSAAGAADVPVGAGHRAATRVADLDDVLAVAAGAVAVAAVHNPAPVPLLTLLALTALVGLLAGLVGWLLFERAHSDAERAVFVLGAIALAGGGAAYLRCSPLLAGVVAGAIWKRLPGQADAVIREDVGRFQHPLVVLLLIVAGALVSPTPVAVWLLGPFVFFRLAGKVLGALLGSRLAPGLRPDELAGYLLSPGLLGIALALNFVQVSASPAATAVASAVALGTLAAELLGLAALPPRTTA